MDRYVTISTFMFPTEVVVVQGRLESEGIECRLKDELTVQVHNFYSNALGGVKLQVPERDAERAKAMLKEWGHIKEGDPEDQTFWVEFDEWTRHLPLIGGMELLIARMVALVAVVLVVLTILLVLLLP
jgi:hypothetical protein